MTDEAVPPEAPMPLMPTRIEQTEWRRETAIRYAQDLVSKQPELLDATVGDRRRRPETHVVAMARLLEMAAMVEAFLANGLGTPEG